MGQLRKGWGRRVASPESDCETGPEEEGAASRQMVTGWRVKKRRMNQRLANLLEWRTGGRRMMGEWWRKRQLAYVGRILWSVIGWCAKRMRRTRNQM